MAPSTAATVTARANGTPTHYEFGGPIGTFFTTLLLPPLILVLSHWAKVGYVDLSSLCQWSKLSLILFPLQTIGTGDVMMTYVYCTLTLVLWFSLLVLLWILLPGPIVQGTVIPQTSSSSSSSSKPTNLRLSYKLNAHATFWVIVGILVANPPLYLLYRYFDTLAWCASMITFGLSVYFYLASFTGTTTAADCDTTSSTTEPKILSTLGNTGSIPYDFWMGRELNPRLTLPFFHLELDWKQFCELRPGLIGWILINLGCAQEQYILSTNNAVSPSMILLIAAQAFYVWDALYQEQAILTTMDITTDGFGFMLCFGDMSWVPFTYTLPAKYLVHHDPQLSWPALGCIGCIYAFGFYLFRSANGQKDVFRRDPQHSSVKHLSFLQTKRGTKLLTGGWWGLARKINYTGDWLMGLTYSLLCGFDSLVPYYYPVYFAVLLIHRSTRDDELCHGKYGDDWLEYKRQVPYVFIPGIW